MTCGGDSVQITPPRRRKRPQNARGGYSDDTQNGTRDNGGSARVLPNLTITQGNTVYGLSPMPSVD